MRDCEEYLQHKRLKSNISNTSKSSYKSKERGNIQRVQKQWGEMEITNKHKLWPL